MALSQLRIDRVAGRFLPHDATARPLNLGLAWSGLAGVTLIAILVRLVTLHAQSAWLDEGYTLAVARHTLPDLIGFTVQYDAHPPLYYALLHLWLQGTGFDLTQARLLSLLCGVGSVLALYAVATVLFDRATGLGAAALLALSPLASWYSDETRMYAMTGFLSLLALFFLVCATRRDRQWFWLAYAVCAALAAYADYSAVYIVIGAAAYALLAVLAGDASPRHWAVAHGVLVALLLPALLMLHEQAQSLSGISWIPAPSPAVVGATLLDLVSFHTIVPPLAAALGLALIALGVLALRRDWRTPRLRRSYIFVACTILAPLCIPLLLSLGQHVFLTRTVMMALDGAIILAVRGLLDLARRWRWWPLALLPILLLNGMSLATAATTTINEDWRGAANIVCSAVTPRDVIIFDPGFLRLPFDVYGANCGAGVSKRGYPYDESLLVAHPLLLRTPNELTSATRGAPSVWLVTRDSNPGTIAPLADVVGAGLTARFGQPRPLHLHDITIYLFGADQARVRQRASGAVQPAAPTDTGSNVVAAAARHDPLP